jgi:hypothetical protein
MSKAEESFTTHIEGTSITVSCLQHEKTMLSLKIREWETKFFNRVFGSLTIHPRFYTHEQTEVLRSALESVLSKADADYDLIELHCHISGTRIIGIIEDQGFRLVDSRITFLTFMEKRNLNDDLSHSGSFFFATPDDLSDVLHLTHESLTDNPSFSSRFKDPAYFLPEETRRYYSAWIENHFDDPDSFFAVSKDNGKTIGFFIYKREGLCEGAPVYKGILSAVAPDYRGQRLHFGMQSFLHNHLPEEQFYVDNTTQLANLPTIKSHIRAGKHLDRIELTFYRRNPLPHR